MDVDVVEIFCDKHVSSKNQVFAVVRQVTNFFLDSGSEKKSLQSNRQTLSEKCRMQTINFYSLETLVGGGKDDDRIGLVGVGDPGFGSIDDPVVTVLGGGCGSSSGVGSISGLG